MPQTLTRDTVGLLGAAGVLLLLVWVVGFVVLGVHGRGWHALVPIGIVLVIAQGIRRMNARGDDPD